MLTFCNARPNDLLPKSHAEDSFFLTGNLQREHPLRNPEETGAVPENRLG
jgi:hypothetical protein